MKSLSIVNHQCEQEDFFSPLKPVKYVLNYNQNENHKIKRQLPESSLTLENTSVNLDQMISKMLSISLHEAVVLWVSHRVGSSTES